MAKSFSRAYLKGWPASMFLSSSCKTNPLVLATLVLSCAGVVAAGCRSGGGFNSAALASSPAEHLVIDNSQPSNNRDWNPDLALLPYAEIDDDQVKIHNIRNCVYRTDDEYVVKHYDKKFDLDRITGVDFIVVPFKATPSLAHTFLSFGFDNK